MISIRIERNAVGVDVLTAGVEGLPASHMPLTNATHKMEGNAWSLTGEHLEKVIATLEAVRDKSDAYEALNSIIVPEAVERKL